MAAIIYTLCALTGSFCALLLARAFLKTRSRLLLWSAICFVGLAVENVALWFDKLILPSIDLSPIRLSVGLCAMAVLLFGLIWEAE